MADGDLLDMCWDGPEAAAGTTAGAAAPTDLLGGGSTAPAPAAVAAPVAAAAPTAAAAPVAAATPAAATAVPAAAAVPALVTAELDLSGFGTPAVAVSAPVAAAPAAAAPAAVELDLSGFDAPAVAAPATAAAAAPAAAVEVAPTPTAAAAATVSPEKKEADGGFDDIDFDAFQSAGPTGGAAAAAPAAAAEATAPAAASTAPVQAPPAAEVDAFDPLVAPAPVEVKKEGISGADLDIFSQKPPENADNMINFGAPQESTEFDPVGHQWAQEKVQESQAAAAAAAAVPVAAASAVPAATAAAPGAPAAVAAVATPVVQEVTAAPAPAPAPKPKQVKGFTGDLLGIGGEEEGGAEAVEEEPPEEDAKKIVYIYHKGERNVIGWYTDATKRDIRDAVLCGCDAIMDHFFVGHQQGFVLREVQFSGEGDEQAAEAKEDGRVFDYNQFHELEHEHTYIMEEAKEMDDSLKEITGDRWRRLRVQVEPLLHVEAQKAVERMRKGSNLLKHTHYGFPHLRQFQLSDDRKRLVWYSGAKRKQDSVINLDEVQEIRLGQTTPVFLHYRLPMLEHLSFSLVYGKNGSKSLDLTCKDEFEFDHWVTGLKAVFYHHKNRQISKEQLLGHSKRFRKALEKNNVGIKLTKLPEVKEKGHVGLDDCIEIVTHTPQQLDTKMERLRERLRTMSQQVARLDHHSAAEMEVDFSLLTGQGPAYANVFVDHEDAQDEEMEIRRMHELVEQTTQLLQQARNELIAINQRQKSDSSGAEASGAAAGGAKGKKKENAACKHVDQLLWKAEVDLENVEDMYLRHIDNQRDTTTPFSVSIADMNTKVQRSFSDVEESVSTKIQAMRDWFR